jgi:hypothetical protein
MITEEFLSFTICMSYFLYVVIFWCGREPVQLWLMKRTRHRQSIAMRSTVYTSEPFASPSRGHLVIPLSTSFLVKMKSNYVESFLL